MGILDDVTTMQSQGMQDKEISKKLQEKGASPKAIEDAFNQIRIKKAVSAESTGEENMEPSIMKATPPQLYVPKTQEIEHESEGFYSPQPATPQFNENLQPPAYADYNQGGYNQGGYGQEEYLPQEGYEEGGATGIQGSYDTDTIIEITEQVFSEKIKKEQKQIESLNEFATLAEARLSDDHERIKRIEETIDKLQIAILEKVGSYGRNLETIKNEMGMMQESFEKMVPSVHERNSSSNSDRERKVYEPKEENYEEEQEIEDISQIARKKLSKLKK